MKKLAFFFAVLISFSGKAQFNDGSIYSTINSQIRLKGASQLRLSGALDTLTKSKVSRVWPGLQYPTVTVGGITPSYDLQAHTIEEILEQLLTPYVNPVFTSFSVSGQATTVEVGTTLSGSKTFTWSIAVNSGVVPTIDLYDNTAASTLLAGTANDGTQAQTVTTIQLNSNAATQSWRGIGNNTSPPGTFNSSNFVVTARFYRFFGPTASSPANSAEVRALPISVFHTGASVFNLDTGNTLTKFVVALPPGVTISQVIDLDALNANITSEYILTGTVNVLDAGSTNRSYNIYEMNIGAAYSTNHRHQITTAN